MKNEELILLAVGGIVILGFVMWHQSSVNNANNAAAAAQQLAALKLQSQMQAGQVAQNINSSNNNSVGGVINTLASSGTLSDIADIFSNL